LHNSTTVALPEAGASPGRRCPLCGDPLPPEAYYEPLINRSGDRDGAFLVRHRKAGDWCEGIAGPQKGDKEGGVG
jgi:hypothetical protein